MARSALLLLGLALCLASATVHAQIKVQPPKPRPHVLAKEILDAVPSDDGNWQIHHEGVKYIVVDDPKTERPYFVNFDTRVSTWTDPRVPEGTQEGGININLNAEMLKQQRRSFGSKSTLLAVAVVPLLIFAAIMVGRIYYLSTYYPDLLWPTKDRKFRQRTNQKFKAQKARGKMSQDGKGGRSANS